MLYIFHVDTGRMMTFDMNLALESVSTLKEMIDRTCNIPQNTQVLLVSGGEVLVNNNRVCSYSAGTDTNPIYMFSTSIIDSDVPPEPSVDYGQDKDLTEEVDLCMSLPATYNTVVSRAQLAQRFYELAKDQSRVCQRLVHDQHLQQQGWAAVVANMEDITEEFSERSANFNNNFSEHLTKRETYLKFLTHFKNDLDILSHIPILPALAVNCKEPFTAFDEVLADKESFSGPEQELEKDSENDSQTEENSNSEAIKQELAQDEQQKTKEAITLLHWIADKENQKSLERIAIQCTKGLDLFDDEILDSMRVECKSAIERANQPSMKEIKGLGDRLFGLEQLMQETKRFVQEQKELAQAILANQHRASHLGDTSILPDLCASHQRQLKVMLTNHQQLRDIRRRCTKAKEELGLNLYHRLKWIVYVENRMFDADNRLMFYHRSLNRLQRHFSIVEQIHQAPSMYIQAINEVVRRRTFSQAFLVWASDLACHLLTIHNEEVMRRREFSTIFEGHFLNALFPGMEDLPPSFATRAPSIFDTGLPKITQVDVQGLENSFPDLVLESSVPDLAAVINFFLARSGSTKSQDKSGTVEERLATVANAAGLSTNLGCAPESAGEQSGFLTTFAQHQHLKDFERGFESETDTEEFEKVGQSPIDCQTSQKNASTSIDLTHLTAENSTSTEENLGATAEEVDNLKQLLQNISCLSGETLTQLRYQLSLMKSEIEVERNSFQNQYDTLLNTWQDYKSGVDISQREKIQRLTVDHELEQNDIKKIVDHREEEISSLKNERASLDVQMLQSVLEHTREKDTLVKTIGDLNGELEKLNQKLLQAEEVKQQALKEMQDKLIHEYKTEMESLRCRFRLMTFTNMERSPSDTSLEKIERTDMIEIVNHEAILLQTKEDMLMEKDKAVKEAVEQERLAWKTKLENETDQKENYASLNIGLENVDMQQLLAEKHKLLEEYREREVFLEKECLKYKETIQRLTESNNSLGSNIGGTVFLSASEDTDKGKVTIDVESDEKAKRPTMLDLNASVAVMQVETATKDVATSPVACRSKHKPLTSSQTSLVQSGRINIASCSVGDHVLIVWNSQHACYTIVQESATLYFLHSDSINSLNLKPGSDGAPKKDYCTGEVEDKEYCHAKKDENRYKVPKGTRFYRVKVKPLQSARDQHLSRSCSHQSPHHSKRDCRSYATSPSAHSDHNVKHTVHQPGVSVETQTQINLPETENLKQSEEINTPSVSNPEIESVEQTSKEEELRNEDTDQGTDTQ